MDVTPLLDRIPFFSNFTDAEKSKLVQMGCYFVKFETGEYLMRENVPDNNAMYIIIKGKAKVTKNFRPEKIIATLEPGMIVGEISFLTQYMRISNVIACEPVICFIITAQTMEELSMQLQHKIKDRLIEILVKRLQSMNQALLDMVR